MRHGVAAHDAADGLSAGAIQAVLDSAGDHLHSLAFVFVRSSPHHGAPISDQFEVMQVHAAQGWQWRKGLIRSLHGSISGHVLNVAAIKDETDRRIAEFWGKKGTKKRRRTQPEREKATVPTQWEKGLGRKFRLDSLED